MSYDCDTHGDSYKEQDLVVDLKTERDFLYRIHFGTRCLRLSFRNFLTREMRFHRRPRGVAKRTQLSGSLLCACVSVCGLCVGLCVCTLIIFMAFALTSERNDSVFGATLILNSRHSADERCVVWLI